MSDPISNLITCIHNGSRRLFEKVDLPSSRVKVAIVPMRRAQNAVFLNLYRQKYWSGEYGAGSFYDVHNLDERIIEHPVVIGPQSNANLWSGDLGSLSSGSHVTRGPP